MTNITQSAQPRKTDNRCAVCRGESPTSICAECVAWGVTLRHIEAARAELREVRQ